MAQTDETAEADLDRVYEHEIVPMLVDKTLMFIDALSGNPLRPYQRPFSARIVESLLLEDVADITALFARQCLDGDTVVFRRDGSAVRLRNYEGVEMTGVKPVRRYRFRGGAEVTATENHPVRTPGGWVAIGDLKPGDKVSSMGAWDRWEGITEARRQVQGGRHNKTRDLVVKITPDFARLVGYLTTDGYIARGQSIKFTNTNTAYLNEVERIALEQFGVAAKRYPKGNGQDLLLTSPRSTPNALRDAVEALEWDHGFPLDVFRWTAPTAAEFINRAWSGDGCVSMKRKGPDIFLACGNDEVYARYWQALLLKFGIRSTVKREVHPKGSGTFHRLVVASGALSTRLFFDVVGEIYGKEEQSAAALQYFDDKRALASGKGRAERMMAPVYGEGCDSELMYWTSFLGSEDAGEMEVFDPHVPGKGWFVAQGLQVSNSGKSETVCNTVAAIMILFPLLAKMYPEHRRLVKFKRGIEVGIFAPVEEQASTLFGRLVDRLTSEQAREILSDPEIDDAAVGKSREVRLKRSLSRAVMMTANPKAKIESKTFHLIVIDEAQAADDFVVRKSISPMKAATAGTMVRTGTPDTRKGDFKRQIDLNKRKHANVRGAKQDHYEADWKEVSRWSPAYKKAVSVDLEKMGEDSDEFQMAYMLRWLLDRGMFTTDTRFEELGDVSMQSLVKSWTRSPVVVGIDPARTTDSTLVTVVFVDWDRPDEFSMYNHRVLNWLELQNLNFESQYFEIVRFLEPYSIYAVAVDAQGMGAAVAERLQILLRHKQCQVHALPSHASEQNKRWKHLQTLMDRGLIGWPSGAKVRSLRAFKRFQQQMLEAEKHFQGPNIMIKAPDEAGAHDDYVDSLALACWCTVDLSVPTVEVVNSPFYASR